VSVPSGLGEPLSSSNEDDALMDSFSTYFREDDEQVDLSISAIVRIHDSLYFSILTPVGRTLAVFARSINQMK
jgi:hypothetical protein